MGNCKTQWSSCCCFFLLLLCVVVSSVSFFDGTLGKRQAKLSKDFQFREKNTGEIQKSVLPHGNRKEKFLHMFALVQIQEDACPTSNGNGKTGVCMTRKKCAAAGGDSNGVTCARGYGACCIVSKKCGANAVQVTMNGTHLTPDSQNFKNLCRYEIPKPKGVCQVRLDFVDFAIQEGQDVVNTGMCDLDTITITADNTRNLGPLCGDLTGQHMYLDYGSNDKLSLDIYLVNNSMQHWDIKTTFIKCDSPDAAPDGCLQYFTGQRDMVTSFNWKNKHQLDDQDYTVCIKSSIGMRKITWTPCAGITNAFSLTGSGVMGPVSITGSDCTTDWVQVLGADKYCGTAFPSRPAVSSISKPFILQVHMNDAELVIPAQPPGSPPCGDPDMPCPGNPPNGPPVDTMNAGFCLMYAQTPN